MMNQGLTSKTDVKSILKTVEAGYIRDCQQQIIGVKFIFSWSPISGNNAGGELIASWCLAPPSVFQALRTDLLAQ